jgi:hypothetical protein
VLRHVDWAEGACVFESAVDLESYVRSLNYELNHVIFFYGPGTTVRKRAATWHENTNCKDEVETQTPENNQDE